MTNRVYFFLFSIGCTLFLWGCQGTRHLPANDKLYIGATVSIKDSLSSSRQKNSLKKSLAGLTRPKPNSKLLGMRPKLAIYNMFRNAKKGLFKNIREKYGEPPVLASQLDLAANTKSLENYLVNKGWFHGKVTADTVVRRKTMKATYTAVPGLQYKISQVQFPSDSSDLSKAIALTVPNTLLKTGEPFDIDMIKAERVRIDAALKEKGFYFFNPDYLLIRTDSTLGNQLVNMYVVVKTETPQAARDIYRINNVYIYTGFNLNADRLDTVRTQGEFYKGYYIVDRRKKYKPFLFEETMQFKPGEIYNRTDHNQTLNRLINLNLFKFVKNRFEPVAGIDSPRLNAFYYLTPQPKQSLRAEIALVSRSNNLNGSQFNISYFNRNIGRSGSQLQLSAYVGSDVQFSGALKGYNTYRVGAEMVYAVPRFVIPFVKKRLDGPYAPRTSIRIGYDILNRRQLYTLNSYRFEYGFTWKKNLQKQHEFFPVAITYAEPLNVTEDYKILQASIPGLERAIEPQFILGSRYQFIYNGLANNLPLKQAWYFMGVADVSGNIAGLITGANIKKGDTVKFGTVPFSQYLKMEADVRHYLRVGLKSTWVNRIDIGIGLPYGNSNQVPYVKQFFVGGNNSLRGFRSRSVGPGTYFPVNVSQIIPDQTGDIKLEFNSEFRPHVAGPLYGALFLDAGNIWLVNDSLYTNKPGAKFTSKFLSQLAVDVGVGLRLDITLFVIRFDVGFPIRKPWVVPPSVINQIDFSSRDWRKQNLVFNLAIGYPF
ncbi:MAG TPA: BamA/TamA family outer membrane protein [Chitinophagaceae bacterium]|jgi:outer membrane protein assembly factor BamA|nr:BamA/TamA family outer membrane protein [Chitinophagaceae bacterium]